VKNFPRKGDGYVVADLTPKHFGCRQRQVNVLELLLGTNTVETSFEESRAPQILVAITETTVA
jgi:hypothetical protein